MAPALSKLYQFTPFIMYDGTNGAAVVAAWNSNPYSGGVIYTGGCTASLTSDTAGTAVIHFEMVDGLSGHTRDLTLHAGDGLFLSDNPGINSWTGLSLSYTSLTDPGIAAGAVKYGGFGEGVVGLLTVGSTNIAVTIKPTQPDTGFVASAFLDGPALALGTVTLGTPVKTSASVVTVPVTNSGVLPVTLSSSTVRVNVTAPQV